MIELDGVAMPLEPGKQYLIAVARQGVSEQTAASLSNHLFEHFKVKALVIRTNGDPSSCIRIIKIDATEEPERG